MSASARDRSRDNWLFGKVGRWVVGIAGGLIIGTIGWSFAASMKTSERINTIALKTGERMSAMEKIDEWQTSRIQQLETGSTTPMANETRATFDAYDHRVSAVEDGLKEIRTMLIEVLRRLPSEGASVTLGIDADGKAGG